MTKSLHHSATHQEHPGKPQRRLVATLQFLAVTLIPVALVVALQRISIEQPLKAGDHAPVLTLKNLSAETVFHTIADRQRLAILFFSTDCPHCKKELTNIERLREMFGKSVQFLLVTRSNRAKTSAMLDSLGIGTPVAIDEEGRAQRAFGVFTVPALFLIDTNGIIQRVSFGEHAFEVRKQQLESFLQSADEIGTPARSPR